MSPGGAGVAVLGHGTWMRRYGGDPAVVGRSMTLNGQPFQIVGVLPASFSLPREVMPTLGGAENAEILLPLPLAADAAAVRNREDYNIIAQAEAGRHGRGRRRPRWTRSPRGCAASIRTSIRPTAG